MTLAVGVDVGVRKGCHVVALAGDASIVVNTRVADPSALGPLLDAWLPDVVAIDSPPAWAPTGQRSRACERALARLGIHCFFTPDAERGRDHPFYRWMTVGFECFAVARALGYEALEVFPHACAVTLLGACAPPGTPRRAWRLAALAHAGVDARPLRALDDLDAALAAFAGLAWCRGTTCRVGHPAEGEIVLPVPTLAPGYGR